MAQRIMLFIAIALAVCVLLHPPQVAADEGIHMPKVPTGPEMIRTWSPLSPLSVDKVGAPPAPTYRICLPVVR